MSFGQIAASDWVVVLGTALGWLVIIIFIVTTRRVLSRLRADFELLSDQVSHLTIAEESRMMREINAQKMRSGQAPLETPQTAAPPVVPVHLDGRATK
jgi:hypothetical protein